MCRSSDVVDIGEELSIQECIFLSVILSNEPNNSNDDKDEHNRKEELDKVVSIISRLLKYWA